MLKGTPRDPAGQTGTPPAGSAVCPAAQLPEPCVDGRECFVDVAWPALPAMPPAFAPMLAPFPPHQRRSPMKLLFPALALGLMLPATSALAAAPGMEKNGMLVDAKGMTLYTFDKDSGGKSACNGGCAQNWPPLMASADAKAMGEWTLIKRDDGTVQWAYKGKPLYTFVQDQKAGDMAGEGKMGVWHMAKP
jgi:predicted lipoprotein with Yx(FWY)xxD motif